MATGGGIGQWIRGLFRGNPPPPMPPPAPPPEPVVRDEDTPHLERWNGKPGQMRCAGARILLENDGKLGSWIQPLTSDREFLVVAAGGERLPVVIPAESDVCWESGQLRQVVLAGPVSFDGMSFPTGTRLLFGDSGALSHVPCPEELELRGIRWARGRTVVFEFGHLHEGCPAAAGVYDGIPYQEHEIDSLHDAGRKARSDLSRD